MNETKEEYEKRKEANRLYKRNQRENNKEFKESEKEANKIYMRNKRQNDREFRESEKQSNKLYMRMKRQKLKSDTSEMTELNESAEYPVTS